MVIGAVTIEFPEHDSQLPDVIRYENPRRITINLQGNVKDFNIGEASLCLFPHMAGWEEKPYGGDFPLTQELIDWLLDHYISQEQATALLTILEKPICMEENRCSPNCECGL